MDEKKILGAVIKSRKAWELVRSHLTMSELSSDTGVLLGLIEDYYSRDSACTSVDVDIIVPSIERQFQNPKHSLALVSVLKALPDCSPENVTHEILEVKRYNVGLRLSAALLHSSSDLSKLYEEYGKLIQMKDLEEAETEEVVEKFQVKDLVEKSFDPKQLIPLYPRTLNDHLGGGIRPGHHVLVFAPTEMGKTLIVINMLAGFVKHKIRVLYVGNEDPVEDLMMRYINRITGLTKAQVMANPDEAQKVLEKRGYEHVVFAPLAPGNFKTIERLVRKHEPKVVILDQLRNIDVDSENRTQALEKAATSARNLGKANGLGVISVAQAGDSASGKRFLTRGDVDGSNVGIPGQCDVMIGVGATEQDEQQNIRFFSFPKNKISGTHEPFQIIIDPQLSMVIEK